MKNYLTCLLLLAAVAFLSCERQEETVAEFDTSTFIDKADDLHYVIIKMQTIPGIDRQDTTAMKAIKASELKQQIDTWNAKDPGTKLRTTQIYFDEETGVEPIFTIRRFNDYNEAKQYSEKLRTQVKTMDGSEKIAAILPISQTNYRVCIKQKSSKAYQYYHDKIITID